MYRYLMILSVVACLGCAAEEQKPKPGGVNVSVPGVDVKVGPDGVKVKAPGTEVQVKP